MRTTCPKSEYLDINPEILALAEELLSLDEIQCAEELSINLAKKSTRLSAQTALKKMVGCRPKRPIYYAYHEIDRLPHWTRYLIENLGHFVDTMVKCVVTEKLATTKYNNQPLGPNLHRLQNKIPGELYSAIEKFNILIYVPAKHDFNVINRIHRFTSKEVVFTIFITLKLKEKLTEISSEVEAYCSDKTNDQYGLPSYNG
jgi:hypothetical protein